MHDDSVLPFSFQFLGAVGLDLPGLRWPSWKKRQGQHSNFVSKGSKCLNIDFLHPLETGERRNITSVEKGGLWMILYSGLVVSLSLLTARLLPFLAGLYFSWFNAFGRATALEPDRPPFAAALLAVVPHIPLLLQLSLPSQPRTAPPPALGGSPLPGQDLLCNSCRGLGNAGQGPYLQR